MKFTPKSDDDFQKEDAERKAKYLWPAKTICDYSIEAAQEKISAKGNEMIQLNVKIFNAEGSEQIIIDYLGEWNLFKLKHICEANGLLEQYQAGNIGSDDLYYKTGKCVLNVQKGAKKDDGSFYPDKNGIQDYLKPIGAVASKATEHEIDDSIPF